MLKTLPLIFFAFGNFALAQVEAISVSGDNPQMTEIASPSGHNTFNYNSFGTRQLGIGLAYEKNWYGFSISDPRDDNSQRTDSSSILFRNFGEYQWGLDILHFKNFALRNGSDTMLPPIANRPDLELYSSQIYVLTNFNHPEFSISDSLSGIHRISESGWAGQYGAKISNTYFHGDQPIVTTYSGTTTNQITSTTMAGLIGIGGTFAFGNFYVASQIGMGIGPVYTTWNDSTGSHNLISFFGVSHVFDLAFGYSTSTWTILFKTATLSDPSTLDSLSFENLNSVASLVYVYRLEGLPGK